jgi:hypothetical protein
MSLNAAAAAVHQMQLLSRMPDHINVCGEYSTGTSGCWTGNHVAAPAGLQLPSCASCGVLVPRLGSLHIERQLLRHMAL